MPVKTLRDTSPYLRATEAQASRLDGLPAPTTNPSTWDSLYTRWTAANDRLKAYTPPVATPAPTPTPPPPPTPAPGYPEPPSALQGINTVKWQIIIPKQLPGERVMKAHVRLTEVQHRPLRINFWTGNGTVNTGSHFKAMGQRLYFEPGVTEIIVDIPVYKDLGPGQNFRVGVGGPDFHPPKPTDFVALAEGAAVQDVTVPPVLPNPYNFAAPALISGRSKTRSFDFINEDILPLDANWKVEAKHQGKWISQPIWGIHVNGEAGINVHQSQYPSVDAHPIVNIGGKDYRALRTGALAQGQEILLDRNDSNSRRFSYWASYLDSSAIFKFLFGYLRFEAMHEAVDPTKSCVDAFWQVVYGASGKSYRERDFFEMNLGGRPGLASNRHKGSWPEGANEGVATGWQPTPGKFHVYEMDITPEQEIMRVDGVELLRRPNHYANTPPMPIIINQSIGGIAPNPPVPPTTTGKVRDFVLKSLDVYQ